MRDNEDIKKIVAAAVEWWRGHRPIGWTHDQHCDNPTVNTSGDTEKGLARAVAEYLK